MIAFIVIGTLVAVFAVAQLARRRRPRPRRSQRRPGARVPGAGEVLEDLIQVVRGPVVALAQRPPRPRMNGGDALKPLGDLMRSARRTVEATSERLASAAAHGRERMHVSRSSRVAAETGARLDILRAWLAPGDEHSSALRDTEVLKEKLRAHAVTAPSQPDERASGSDVDRLKEKLHADPTPAKTPETETTATVETLTAKLRQESERAKKKLRKIAPDTAAKSAPKHEVAPPQPLAPEPDVQPLVVLPAPSATRPAHRQTRRDEGRQRSDERCSIKLWRGYVKSSFCAVAPDDPTTVIAESPFFRWLRPDPPDSDASVAAHRTLVALLERDGWTPVGKGDQWFELRFRRPKVPARSSPPAAHRHDREEHHV